MESLVYIVRSSQYQSRTGVKQSVGPAEPGWAAPRDEDTAKMRVQEISFRTAVGEKSTLIIRNAFDGILALLLAIDARTIDSLNLLLDLACLHTRIKAAWSSGLRGVERTRQSRLYFFLVRCVISSFLLGTVALAGTKATSWDGDGGSMAVRVDFLVEGNVHMVVQEPSAIVETFAKQN
ncbi:hypothetical protein BpHYR1_023273 [Brachionus plicatilis]|uniref:Uncharacterized protein n=1 Tax=Brachionus plicatilis TaxID=10195 RepID=A0A3M7Q5R2_BRAPC|nr:hypothetical protein BpHYR1_023273 [Brachionus plicatilis]